MDPQTPPGPGPDAPPDPSTPGFAPPPPPPQAPPPPAAQPPAAQLPQPLPDASGAAGATPGAAGATPGAAGPPPGWQAAAPSAPSAPAGGPPPSGWQAGAAQASSGSGCVKGGLIVIALIVVAIIALGAIAVYVVGNAFRDAGFDPDTDGSFGAACPFLSNDDARSVMGGAAQADLLTGIVELSIGFVADNRALAEDEDCWVHEGEAGSWARVARHAGSDAAARYAAERAAANPTSEDRGGGITVETDGWVHKDLSGVGDEGFCLSATGSGGVGALIRYGDRVVFASLQPADFQRGDYAANDQGNLVSDKLCDQAIALASKVRG